MATAIDPADVEPRALLETDGLRDARVLEVVPRDGRLTFRYAEEANAVVGIGRRNLSG
jgi:hypothetical protein